MSGRKIWINFEAHQGFILHISPWNKFSDLKLFSKWLTEPPLSPLRLNFEILNFFFLIKTYSWQPQKCNAEADPILSSRHLWPKSIRDKWLWFLSQCHSWSPNQTRKRHDVDQIKLPRHELHSNEINIVYICISMFKSVKGLNFRLGI